MSRGLKILVKILAVHGWGIIVVDLYRGYMHAEFPTPLVLVLMYDLFDTSRRTLVFSNVHNIDRFMAFLAMLPWKDYSSSKR